jgi:hypothetical protein
MRATAAGTTLRCPSQKIISPQFGPYNVTLPIAFSTQLATRPSTGKYALTASADGYASQVNSSVDIATANQSGINFTLVP